METWRKVWRDGLAPLLSDDHLQALREMLAADDVHLLQGCTTTPPPLQCVQDWPVEACCPLALGGVITNGGFGAATVAHAEEWLVQVIYRSNQILGDPTACSWFLNWFDESPRAEARRELHAEVIREQQRRAGTLTTEALRA